VLPVQLVDFYGTITSAGNQLNWRVENEKDFKEYEVQTSGNRLDFSKVGIVNATNKNYYRFDHSRDAIPEGKNYYRLKMIDLDGRVTYSNIISLHNRESRQITSIYPNPAKENITVSSTSKLIQVSIVDRNGKAVLVVPVKNKNTEKIGISNLPSGLYSALIKTEAGVITEKFIKF
jgi:hypothetical protein